jgi:hypothetical protein
MSKVFNQRLPCLHSHCKGVEHDLNVVHVPQNQYCDRYLYVMNNY